MFFFSFRLGFFFFGCYSTVQLQLQSVGSFRFFFFFSLSSLDLFFFFFGIPATPRMKETWCSALFHDTYIFTIIYSFLSCKLKEKKFFLKIICHSLKSNTSSVALNTFLTPPYANPTVAPRKPWSL